MTELQDVGLIMLRCQRSPYLPSSGSVDFRLVLSSYRPLASEGLAELTDLIDDWTWLVAHGAFCAPPARPVDSTLLSRTVLTAGGGVHTWRVELQEVHPGAFDVLFYALYAFGQIVHPVEELSVLPVQTTMQMASMPPSWGPLFVNARGYPPLAENQLGFDVSLTSRTITGATRRMVIRMATPLDEFAEAKLRTLIGHWEMVVFCAYPSSVEALESGRCAIFNSETTVLDDSTLELCIDDFGGVDSAWHPLLNSLAAMSVMGPRVLDVVIE